MQGNYPESSNKPGQDVVESCYPDEELRHSLLGLTQRRGSDLHHLTSKPNLKNKTVKGTIKRQFMSGGKIPKISEILDSYKSWKERYRHGNTALEAPSH